MKRIDHESHILWQAQYSVKLHCYFSWQAQYFVKFGMIAGARNVCIFQYKMLVANAKSNLGHEAGCGLTVSCSDHARIILGTVSDRPRIVNDVSSVFSHFGRLFFVAGAVFGEFGQ